ncbi:MAG: hypothetical protein Q7R94_00165 [bacterium]|nr:hypothetical protein [bacterium]
MFDDFIVKNQPPTRFGLGKTTASALSGFIVGVLITLIILSVVIHANAV